jgi:hypothetical protein
MQMCESNRPASSLLRAVRTVVCIPFSTLHDRCWPLGQYHGRCSPTRPLPRGARMLTRH